MGRLTQLCTADTCLQIGHQTKDWCQLWLVRGENARYLGSTNLNYLVNRLQSVLCNHDQSSIGEIQGHPVCWVLSLDEAHTTLYITIATTEAHRLLFWQDRDARIIDTMTLSTDDGIEWRQQLHKLNIQEGI